MIICIIFNNFLEKFSAVHFCSGQYAYQEWLTAYKITVYNTDQGRQIHSNLEISGKAVLFYWFMSFIMAIELKNLSKLLPICSE